MSSVGAYLRQLREARGVSLEEIARATRVNSSYLHALEADDHGELPAPAFTRGFIRAYCQTLGEPPDQALALYAGRGEVVAGASVPSAPVVPRPVSAPTRTASEPPPRNRGPVLVSFILLVVLGVALFAVTLALQAGRESGEDRRAARPVTPPPAPRGAEPPPVSPPDTRVPTSTNAPGSTPGYRLVARTVEPTWMRVRTGDGRTMEETIPAGQMREWFSPTPFTLTVGNAGGVRLELNGRQLPPLGPSGAVIPRLVVPTESP
jgi:cytoskeletal protein RodZ